jgi:cell wall-associated NlpC family hydrolase
MAVTLIAIETPAAQAGGGNQDARIIRIAKSHLGAKFRIGTEGMRYFDCSGFVYRVYKQAGLINRIGGNRKRAAGYYAWFRKRGLVSRGNPRSGDLIVWTKKGRIAHIGIFMHGNRAISALTSGVRTHRIRTLDTKFKAYLHVRLDR